jgi:hypothetical protein
MTGAKVRLLAALVLFLGWLTWLGITVFTHRTTPPEIVSRSQMLAATTMIVADVTVGEDGLPGETVTVANKLGTGHGPASGTVKVRNLKSAQSSLSEAVKTGRYLLLLTGGENDIYEIAGWPRSSGVEARYPGEELMENKKVRRPVVYLWTTAVEAQLKSLGFKVLNSY